MQIAYYKSGILQKVVDITPDKSEFLISRVGGEGDFLIEDPRVSKPHAKLTFLQKENCFLLEDLQSSNGTFYKGEKISQTKLNLEEEFSVGVPYVHRFVLVSEKIEESKNKFDLKQIFSRQSELLIGRSQNVNVLLASPNISKQHAKITFENENYYIEDLHSTNGTFINEIRIFQKTKLNQHDKIRIGNFFLIIENDTLYIQDVTQQGVPSLIIKNITKRVKARTLLHNINLHIESKELVAIMGPSGCGKTTLLKILNGYDSEYEGEVLLHGLNLKQNLSSLKSLIGYVPQEDTIHKELSVYDALYYGCKLRLPKDTSEQEIEDRISKVLSQLRISHIRNSLIKNISGGERKRVCIALELLSDPAILFLDEPTSPLDPQTIQDFLEILQNIANQNKTIVIVTHKPEDLHYLQKVIFLARGGYLAFYGKTNSYLEYFGVKNTIEVYSILNEKIQTSQIYSIPEISSLNSSFSPKVKKESFVKQFLILSKRMFRIKLNDRINTLLLLLQAPLIALLSCIIFEKTNLSSLFVMILSTIWFGTNNTARDIVGELSIYMRERMFNLRIDSYLIAKVFTAWVFSFLQLIPFVWIMHIFLTLESPVKIFFFLSLLALCAILMGLILSAMFDNTEKVMTLVPISLIPQILLSGVMEKIRNGFVEFISYFTITRWGMNAIAFIQKEVYAQTLLGYQWVETKNQIEFKHFYELSTNLIALGAMIVSYFIFLYYLMKRKDSF